MDGPANGEAKVHGRPTGCTIFFMKWKADRTTILIAFAAVVAGWAGLCSLTTSYSAARRSVSESSSLLERFSISGSQMPEGPGR